MDGGHRRHAGQKAHGVNRNVAQLRGTARHKILVELITGCVQHTQRRCQQCLLPQRNAVQPKLHGHGHTDAEGTVDIDVRPLADVGVQVCGAEPQRRDGFYPAGLHGLGNGAADLGGQLRRLRGQDKDRCHNRQRNGQCRIFCVFFHGGSPAALFLSIIAHFAGLYKKAEASFSETSTLRQHRTIPA